MVAPSDAAALTVQQRGERYGWRMAGILERGTGHIEAMTSGGILDRIDELEKLDRVSRRTFGMNEAKTVGIEINIGLFDL